MHRFEVLFQGSRNMTTPFNWAPFTPMLKLQQSKTELFIQNIPANAAISSSQNIFRC